MIPSLSAWIEGTVIHGDGRGAGLGFPTANILLDRSQERPAEGIYACRARLEADGQQRPAVAHIGPRPTFPGFSATVEIHILNFPPQDLYGKRLAFCCVKKIRAIAKFSSVQALQEAIAKDCQEAAGILTLTS